jgi:septum formation inhibitor MinC
MKKRNYILIAIIAVISIGGSGCEGSEVARQMALQLRSAVIEDEQLIDQNIASQTAFYKKQQATIDGAREKNKEFKLDALRRMRSAQAATNMSLDPNKEARLAKVMNYLHETHDQEFEAWQDLYGGDQLAREELKTKIAKLERQKKVLEQVKSNLNSLAIAPSSKKRASALLKYSQATYAAYKEKAK